MPSSLKLTAQTELKTLGISSQKNLQYTEEKPLMVYLAVLIYAFLHLMLIICICVILLVLFLGLTST